MNCPNFQTLNTKINFLGKLEDKLHPAKPLFECKQQAMLVYLTTCTHYWRSHGVGNRTKSSGLVFNIQKKKTQYH